jgi:hypothetical protein
MEHTDDQLLAMALANLGEYIHDNSPQYILIEDDPRNEEDYDTWEYGTEPLPHDHTWQHTSIDLSKAIKALLVYCHQSGFKPLRKVQIFRSKSFGSL